MRASTLAAAARPPCLAPGDTPGTSLGAWLRERPQLDTFVIIGDCTDLCVYSAAMHLRLEANALNLRRLIQSFLTSSISTNASIRFFVLVSSTRGRSPSIVRMGTEIVSLRMTSSIERKQKAWT